MSSEAKNVDVSNLLFYSNSSHLRDATTLLRARQFRPMSLFRNAQFEISIAKPSGLPPPNGPEVAFAGRSNAGKSSAINTLANHTRLAFVSKTPGRTQQLVYFQVTPEAHLVDLPGYGEAPADSRSFAEIARRIVDGLPVGVQLLAPYFQEGRLLNVAHQYQLNTDWHTRTPTGF